MIILGWIGVVLLIITSAALIGKGSNETFREAFIDCLTAFVTILGFIGLAWLVFLLIATTVSKKEHKPDLNIPSLLVCNNVTVAESVNGFAYNSKSGTYEDYPNNLTYTPRQGEVCKEYLKGSE